MKRINQIRKMILGQPNNSPSPIRSVMMRLSHLPKPAVALVGVFLAASLLVPLPYAVLEPGEGQNVLGSVIKISNQRTYPTTGKLLLTTVYATSPGSVLFGVEVLHSWLSASSIVLPREVLYPPNQSSKEIDKANLVEMVDSQQNAAAAALTYLKFVVTKEPVTNKDGSKSTKYLFPFPVNISLKDTGGPSGGLIFALGIVEKLTPEDLLKGRVVAGTGTISIDGHVGAIGGIDDKIIAAKKAGATLFLAPADNCADVTHIPSGITIYSVKTLAEAVGVLEDSKNAVAHCTWQRNR
jgi:PDZ domain-containing protein